MEESLLDILEGLIEGRNMFLGRTLNQLRPANRESVLNRFLLNEVCYLEFANRIHSNYVRSQQPQLVLNLPANFLDSVPVTATSQQIADSLESVEGTQANCAICQDTIHSNGSRIRRCGHTYHRDCIRSWLTMSVRCPVCRHDIREDPAAQTSVDDGQTTLPDSNQ